MREMCLSCLQDMCTRVWDLRKSSESSVLLYGRLGAVRSLRYSPDGRLLAASEPADFVQLYDVTSGYRRYKPSLDFTSCRCYRVCAVEYVAQITLVLAPRRQSLLSASWIVHDGSLMKLQLSQSVIHSRAVMLQSAAP